MDRIDLHVRVPEVSVDTLIGTRHSASETSASVRTRVQRARDMQIKRFSGTSIRSNGEMMNKSVKEYCPLSPEILVFLRQAVAKMHLSARSYYRVIKLSRTIADLSAEREIAVMHIAEALQYRPAIEF